MSRHRFEARSFVPTFLPFLALAALDAGARAQGSSFATQVAAFSPGPGGSAAAANALGGPTGEGPGSGSTDVVSLGAGGSLTLGFDVVIADGPGTDLVVFENGLVFGGEVFSEVAFVEVSSDGAAFARFPSRYAGPATGLPGFTAPFGTYSGLTGGMPVIANVVSNNVSPFDPVVSGGEAFDLAALASHPAVVAGTVDLGAIRWVRIVDAPNGQAQDSSGNTIYDNDFSPTDSADVDAVAVVHHQGDLGAGGPHVDLSLDALGHLVLRITDPSGAADLDRATLQASWNLAPLSARRLRELLPVATPVANGIELRSAAPVAGSGLFGVFAASIRDHAGTLSSDQLAVQG